MSDSTNTFFQSEDGPIKKRMDYVDNNPLTKLKEAGRMYAIVPKWVVGVAGIVFGLIVTIFIATIVVVYNAPRPSLHAETCDRRSCVPELNLKCINNSCTCSENQYFAKKCIDKKNYLEACSSTTPCKNGSSLLCRDGKCKCSNLNYWKDGNCIPKNTFKQSCSSDVECLESKLLYCDTNTRLCTCSSTR